MSDIITYHKVSKQDKVFSNVVSKFTVMGVANKFRVARYGRRYHLQATRINGRIYQVIKAFDSKKDAEDFIFTHDSAEALEAIE